MIRINLLPEKEVKRRRAARPAVPARQVSPLTILIAVAVVAVLGGYYHVGVRRPLIEKRAEEVKLESELGKVNKDIEGLRKGVAELKAAESISKSMLEIAHALDPEDRLLWSEKLNQFSDLAPDNVFITRVTVAESITKTETFESERRRKEWRERQKTKAKAKRRKGELPGEPTPIYYPQIMQTLTIEAIAHAETESERIRLMSQFHDNLLSGTNAKGRIETDFMKGFTGRIEWGSFDQEVVGGRSVAKFSFTLTTRPTSPKSARAAGGS
ncbi:hypothetical protein AMJ85_00665 [candidate division BRC1 bacterium SM23_51]|nr:MAG: hypothetical protein AMJ85_00665 [candidate division BRC1 bacterium SM23_51]